MIAFNKQYADDPTSNQTNPPLESGDTGGGFNAAAVANSDNAGNKSDAVSSVSRANSPVDSANVTAMNAALSATNLGNDLDELIASSTDTVIGGPNVKTKVEFGTSSDETQKHAKQEKVLHDRRIPKRIMVFISIIVLLLVGSVLMYLFYQYIIYQQTGNVQKQVVDYMPWVEEQYTSIMKTLGLEDTKKYTPQVVVTTNEEIVGTVIQDKALGFISKKKLFQAGTSLLYATTAEQYGKYDTLKKEVGEQGFFPKEIQALAQGVFFDNSLQRAIVSIESVRFATAMKFFSSLDSFLSQLSSYTQTNKEELVKQLNVFMARGEKDINNYIVSCYLNGYELSTQCNTIKDFNTFYTFYQDFGLNQANFLRTMNALEAKLENTDFPSLEINMKSIDPLNNTINLNIEVNTFLEDEAQLTAIKQILNPHIYLVTSVINNLRESRYVLTDSINVSSLKVEKKKIKIGGQTVVVNASSFDFRLPLQNNVQREIYDFTENLVDYLKKTTPGVSVQVKTGNNTMSGNTIPQTTGMTQN